MLSLSTLLPLAARTIREPRDTAQYLLRLNLPGDVLWQLLALVVVLSIILAELSNLAVSALSGVALPDLFISPLLIGALQFVLLVGMVHAIFWVGRAMGGTGSLNDGLTLVTWLQFVMVCLQALQSVLLLISPSMATIVGLIGVVLLFWLLTHFVAVVHDFPSLGKVFGMILITLFAAGFGLSILLRLLGIDPAGLGLGNV